MIIRAKFACDYKSQPDSNGLVNITLSPGYTGSEENKQFCRPRYEGLAGAALMAVTTGGAALSWRPREKE